MYTHDYVNFILHTLHITCIRQKKIKQIIYAKANLRVF
jgi:hypothetical protein